MKQETNISFHLHESQTHINESARFLAELQEKAQRSLIAKDVINNPFNAEVTWFNSPQDGGMVAYVSIKLNGRLFETKVKIDSRKIPQVASERYAEAVKLVYSDLMSKIKDDLGKKIALTMPMGD